MAEAKILSMEEARKKYGRKVVHPRMRVTRTITQTFETIVIAETEEEALKKIEGRISKPDGYSPNFFWLPLEDSDIMGDDINTEIISPY